jgi:iron complex outermembrane receptor protein
MLWAAAPVLLASSMLTAPNVARAQTEGVLEEVVVTATRREERLQDIPVAVTAIGGQALETQSISSVSDLQRVVPSLTIRPFPGDNTSASITMRGLGTGDNLISVDPTVGTYLDGVYLGRATGANLGMLDVARVEALRGPQGTLFGRNTIGGALSVVSNQPSQQREGMIGAGIGNYNLWYVEGVANVPITDQLALRVAGRHSDRSGYAKSSLTGADLNAEESNFIRAILKYDATDDLQFTVSGDYSDVRTQGQWVTLVAVNPTGSFLREAAFTGVVPRVDAFDKHPASSARGPFTASAWGVSGTMVWNVGPGTFKSISAYRSLVRDNRNNDLDGTPAVGITQFIGYADQEQVSQELQYYGDSMDGRLDWIGGVYYFRESGIDLSRSSFLPRLTDFGGAGCPAGPGVFDNCPAANSITHGRAVNKSASAFAQIGFDITSQLKVNLGARYVEDRRALTLWSRGVNPASPIVVNFSEIADILSCTTTGAIRVNNCRATPPSAKFHYTPYTVGLDYHPLKDILLYAKYSKGYRSGGFNIRGTTTGALSPFSPESAKTAEIGVKSELLDRRLRLNVAAYHTNYQNIQLNSIIAAPPPALTTSTVVNAGEQKVKGVEWEATLRMGALTLNTSGAYTDAKFTKILPSVPATDVTLASMVVGTPKWMATVSADYAIEMGEDTLTLHAGYDWRDDTAFANVPPRVIGNLQKAYGLLSGRVTYAMKSGLELSAWGANLTNKKYLVGTTDQYNSLGYLPGFPGEPRTYGVGVRHNF